MYKRVSKCGIFANSKLREVLVGRMLGISRDKNVRSRVAGVSSNCDR
jgi:hypothetical protein